MHPPEPEPEPTLPAPAILPARKQIAILGTTPTRLMAPIPDPQWTIWTIGPGGKDLHRWDALFEVHHVWPSNFCGYLNDLSQVKPPARVFTLRPAHELMKRWRLTHGDTEETRQVTGDWAANAVLERDYFFEKYRRKMWFSSSISYCIAQAIEEEATDIGLYGIDLESGEEYVSQFCGCAHLIDVAHHQGITFHMPDGCGLERDINPYPERYETNFALTTEKKGKFFGEAAAKLEGEWDGARCNLLRCEGAIIALRNANAPADMIQHQEAEHLRLSIAVHQLWTNLCTLRGENSATQFYRSRFVSGMQDPQ